MRLGVRVYIRTIAVTTFLPPLNALRHGQAAAEPIA